MNKVSVPNYDKFPATKTDGRVWTGWEAIASRLSKEKILAVDCYTGVYEDQVEAALSKYYRKVIRTEDLMKSEEEVRDMTSRFMTDDVLFGYVSPLRMEDFFEKDKIEDARLRMCEGTLIIGPGAALLSGKATLVYADMARWEIQQRFRAHRVNGLGVNNAEEAVSLQYKRGYFIDWRALDYYKDSLFRRIGWYLDTNDESCPKLTDADTFLRGMALTARKPFRVVPFFDPAPWGGQWMKEVCDLDRGKVNYGWCFDCVPEENSLLLEVDGVKLEFPSQDLVLLHSRELLGAPVEGRFGKDFPIRFDFLDTMGGGNLSLQVHPTTQFIREQFGMAYTQDESYYIMDAGDDATVFLGVRNGVDKEAMLEDLRAAQRGERIFDAEKYVNRFPAKKHDHFLIPGGTIHCSGANAMVLEISATPNLFTFKLWDWSRLGLDGKPRPINVERGSKVIQWNRDTDYAKANLVNHFTPTAKGKGWEEISTGLHPAEFIESRRLDFSTAVTLKTAGSVQVLNLVEGEAAVVSSPSGAFEPYEVHYAETFIIPACLEEFTLSPAGEGKKCKVIRAFVRFNP